MGGRARAVDVVSSAGGHGEDVNMLKPAGMGPVADLHRLLFENFDPEQSNASGQSRYFETRAERAVRLLSRGSGVLLLAVGYGMAGYLLYSLF